MGSEVMYGGEFTQEHDRVDLSQLFGVFAHEVTQVLFGVD